MESNTAHTEEEIKQSPFDFVRSVTETKENIYYEGSDSFYIPFIINRALSNQPDCLFAANEINKFRDVPKKTQYEYYFHLLDKRRRYGAWAKNEKNSDVELIMAVYGYNRQRAEHTLPLLNEEQLKKMRNRHGGRFTL